MEPVLNNVSIVSLAATAVMAIVAYILAYFIGKKCSKMDKMIMFWLIWDTMIHIIIEGSFVYISLTGTVAKSNNLMAEMWKEYGKADKRWLVSDPNIVSLEILTVALCSLLCIVLIYAIAGERYYRHWIQIVLCVCELYGGWMTFCPDWLIGSPNLATDNFLHLWVYLVFFNGLWVIIPAGLMYQSWNAMRDAFSKRSSGGQRSSASVASPKSGRYNLRTKKTH